MGNTIVVENTFTPRPVWTDDEHDEHWFTYATAAELVETMRAVAERSDLHDAHVVRTTVGDLDNLDAVKEHASSADGGLGKDDEIFVVGSTAPLLYAFAMVSAVRNVSAMTKNAKARTN